MIELTEKEEEGERRKLVEAAGFGETSPIFAALADQGLLPGAARESPTNKKPQKPRRDKGTARLLVPKGLAKQLEADAKLAGVSVPELLVNWRELATRPVEEVPQLPKAVLAILGPAAEATGRSMTALIEDYSVFLAALLTGELYREGSDPSRSPCDKHMRIPSMADFLTERFRAKLEGR